MANGQISVTVVFGGNTLTLTNVPAGSNLGCLRQNKNVALTLGYSPASVDLILNGSRASDSTVISDGDTVNVQHKAHEKAVS